MGVCDSVCDSVCVCVCLPTFEISTFALKSSVKSKLFERSACCVLKLRRLKNKKNNGRIFWKLRERGFISELDNIRLFLLPPLQVSGFSLNTWQWRYKKKEKMCWNQESEHSHAQGFSSLTNSVHHEKLQCD